MMLACPVDFRQKPPREQMPSQKMWCVYLWKEGFPLLDLEMLHATDFLCKTLKSEGCEAQVPLPNLSLIFTAIVL